MRRGITQSPSPEGEGPPVLDTPRPATADSPATLGKHITWQARPIAAKLNWPRWAQALLIAVLVLMIGNRLIMLVDSAAVRSGLIGEYGTDGGDLMRVAGAKPGFLKAVRRDAGRPLGQGRGARRRLCAARAHLRLCAAEAAG